MAHGEFSKGHPSVRRKQWCPGLAHRGENNLTYRMVQVRDSATMLPIIAKYVRWSSAVVSNGWHVYPKAIALNASGRESLNLTYELVCRSKEFVAERRCAQQRDRDVIRVFVWNEMSPNSKPSE